MKYLTGLVFTFAAALVLTAPAFAADPPAKAQPQMPEPGNPGAFASNEPAPVVPPAGPGVFQAQKRGANGFRLVLTGHKFVSRQAAELYLAYRASEITAEQKGSWFTFTENRTKGDTAPVPKRDPAANRFSFRMEFFRPVWRYKTGSSPEWKRWSPFSGTPFPEAELKNASVYELTADITVRKGFMDDADPLAFEAGAVNDFLVNQVSPPT